MPKTDAQKAAAKAARDAKKAASVVPPSPTVGNPPVPAGFDFAANGMKLHRAIAWVRQTRKEVKEGSGEFTELVRARYVEIGGLLNEDKMTPSKGGKGGKVVNLAEDNVGDDDDE